MKYMFIYISKKVSINHYSACNYIAVAGSRSACCSSCRCLMAMPANLLYTLTISARSYRYINIANNKL